MDDEKLIPYVENTVYSDLVSTLSSDDYFVDNVKAVYVSEEYIEELTYNSQSNIYFGYTLDDLNKQFQGSRYIFTIDDKGKTEARKMETFYDDSTEQIIKNVAIGGGVILICVTVSAVSAGVGAPAVSMIFAASAKTGTAFALSSGAISGMAAAITTGYQTGDLDEAIKAGAIESSEGFKWGAISGVIAGGGKAAVALHGATLNGLTMNEAALIQNESGYPLDVIKQFKSLDEYNIYKSAGLKVAQIGNRSALIRTDIDPDYISYLGDDKVTNLQRMAKGYAPIYKDSVTGIDKAYQLHHINQNPNGTLAILTESEHQGNSAVLNIFGKESEIDRQNFNAVRRQFWMDFAAQIGGM